MHITGPARPVARLSATAGGGGGGINGLNQWCSRIIHVPCACSLHC